MFIAALALIVAAGVAQLIGFALLVSQALEARRVLNAPDAFAIDGGNPMGEVEGNHLGETVGFLFENVISTWWALVLIAFGIAAGTSGSVLALWA